MLEHCQLFLCFSAGLQRLTVSVVLEIFAPLCRESKWYRWARWCRQGHFDVHQIQPDKGESCLTPIRNRCRRRVQMTGIHYDCSVPDSLLLSWAIRCIAFASRPTDNVAPLSPYDAIEDWSLVQLVLTMVNQNKCWVKLHYSSFSLVWEEWSWGGQGPRTRYRMTIRKLLSLSQVNRRHTSRLNQFADWEQKPRPCAHFKWCKHSVLVKAFMSKI